MKNIGAKFNNVVNMVARFCAVATSVAIPLSTAATVTLFPVTVFLSLISGNLREKFRLILRNPITWVLTVFFLMFLLGIIYSTGSWHDIYIIMRKYVRFFLAIIILPIFMQKKSRDHAINAFIFAILVLLICSYFRDYGWLKTEAKGIIEIFKHSIEFNFLMSFGAYLVLIKIFSYERYRFMWIVLFIMLVHTVLFRSMGRTGYFVFASLIGLFCMQKLSWRGIILSASIVALLFGAANILSPTFHGRMQAIFTEIQEYERNDITSVGLRITFAKNSLKIIKRHPFLGTGTGSFAKEYAATDPNPLSFTRNPHNEYLHIAVQFGLLGLVVLLLFFFAPLWYSRFLPEREKYIARGVVVGIMVGSLANSWLLDVTEGYFYAYFIVLAFAAFPLNRLGKQ